MWSAGAYRCLYIYIHISFLYVSSIQKLCFLSCIKALGHVKHNKMHFLCGCLTTRVDMASVRIVAALIKKNQQLPWKCWVGSFWVAEPCGSWQSSLALPHKALESLLAAKEATRTTQILRNALMSLGDPKFLEGLGGEGFGVQKVVGKLLFLKWGHYLSLFRRYHF